MISEGERPASSAYDAGSGSAASAAASVCQGLSCYSLQCKEGFRFKPVRILGGNRNAILSKRKGLFECVVIVAESIPLLLVGKLRISVSVLNIVPVKLIGKVCIVLIEAHVVVIILLIG